MSVPVQFTVLTPSGNVSPDALLHPKVWTPFGSEALGLKVATPLETSLTLTTTFGNVRVGPTVSTVKDREAEFVPSTLVACTVKVWPP